MLDVEKVAVFIEDVNNPGQYMTARAIGLSDTYKVPADFRDMIRQKSAEKGVVRADELDFSDIDILETNGNGNGKPGNSSGRSFIILCRAWCAARWSR